jgi:hypothetical protein
MISGLVAGFSRAFWLLTLRKRQRYPSMLWTFDAKGQPILSLGKFSFGFRKCAEITNERIDRGCAGQTRFASDPAK